MKKLYYFLLLVLVLIIVLVLAKISISERARIFWNKSRYFYDGRHKISGTPESVCFDLDGELWVKNKKTGKFIRLIPNAGIELEGEQNLSLISSRKGDRTMFKLRPQLSKDAEKDYLSGNWKQRTNQYYLFFEQRDYSSNNVLVSYYKDAAYGKGGIFFVNPETGEHIAHDNFSTLYVPDPTEKSFAGPSNWLWAAAANRQFVETAVTGKTAETAWNEKYYKRVKPPENKMSPGEPGDIAFDDNYIYIYHSKEKGWLRIKTDSDF